MQPSRTLIGLITAALLAGCGGFPPDAAAADGGLCLRMTNRNSGAVVLERPFRPAADRFAFLYIHSVEKTPVWEFYTLDAEGRVVLLETRVQSGGHGLPHPDPGDHYGFEDGYIVIEDMDRMVGRLRIRVNFVRLMEIRTGDVVIDLRDHGRAGDLIEIDGQACTGASTPE